MTEQFQSRSQEKRLRTLLGQKNQLEPRCPSCGSVNYQTSLRPWCPNEWHQNSAKEAGVTEDKEKP